MKLVYDSEIFVTETDKLQEALSVYGKQGEALFRKLSEADEYSLLCDAGGAGYVGTAYRVSELSGYLFASYQSFDTFAELFTALPSGQVLDRLVPVVLSSPILTVHGSFQYEPLSLSEAKALASDGEASAVDHESTAEVVSALLGHKVEMNRVQFQQEYKQSALVFKLNGRPKGGEILSVEEIEEIGYSWGLLTRTA
jgi:hypothetical protein